MRGSSSSLADQESFSLSDPRLYRLIEREDAMSDDSYRPHEEDAPMWNKEERSEHKPRRGRPSRRQEG